MKDIDSEDLDSVIDLFRKEVAVAPSLDPDRAAKLSNLGLLLQLRFLRTGQLQDLEEAIETLRTAVAAAPSDDPERARWLGNLGTALQTRCLRTRDSQDHEEAVELLRAAVAAAPSDHPERPRWLANLGVTLQFRFVRSWEEPGFVWIRDPQELDEAMTSFRAALTAAPSNHPDRAIWQGNFGSALQTRFGYTGNLQDLEEAVKQLRAAVAAAPSNHPDHAIWQGNFGSALQTRFGYTGNLQDLEEAVKQLRAAVAAAPPNHPNHAIWLGSLGAALQYRFQQTEDLLDLEDAVKNLRAALTATTPDHPQHTTLLSSLGAVLQSRFQQTRNQQDLEEAVETCQAAVTAAPVNHPDLARRLSNIGRALQYRFEQTGALRDLEQAVKDLRAAVAVAPPNHPDHAIWLGNLGTALRSLFEQTGKPQDLEESVNYLRAAALAVPANHPDHARRIADLGSALQSRFQQTGDPQDIEEAVESLRIAAGVAPVDSPLRIARLSNLGIALLSRFKQSGSPQDLEDAVEMGRACLAAASPDALNRAGLMANLASALHTRFVRSGDLRDIEDSEKFVRAALASVSDDPSRVTLMASLGTVLHSRFKRTGNLHDLKEAVEAGRAAVTTNIPNHPDRANLLANLGMALQSHFEQTGELQDTQEAVEFLRDAIAATGPNDPDRARMLSNLGAILYSRFKRTGELQDAADAAEVGRAALAATASGHSDRARRLWNLGAVLQSRFEQVGDTQDIEEAVRYLREAAESTVAPAEVRVRAGQAWGRGAVAMGDPATGVKGYRLAVGLLTRLAVRGLSQSDREFVVAEWAGLAAEAAACAIAASQPSLAVELVEQGRGVLWSQMLDGRTDMTELAEHDRDLVEKIQAALTELDARTPDGTVADAVPPVTEDRSRSDVAAAANRQLDELLTTARDIAGFDRFMLPPKAVELQRSAEDGPVVIVNVAELRCDALLVRTDAVVVQELPELTAEEILGRVTAYFRVLAAVDSAEFALHQAVHDLRGGSMSGAAIHRRDQAARALDQARSERDTTLAGLLQWLWDVVADPVLTALGFTSRPGSEDVWPRMWWCPTGLLTLLPLHAAGHLDQLGDRAVLDRVVSSYTPTVRALVEARRSTLNEGLNEGASEKGLLVVSVPEASGALPLTAVMRERDRLIVRFPEAHKLLDGPDATRSAVARALRRFRWAHFSCHGGQDLTAPGRGGLLLSDGLLSVSDIAAWRHDGEFAFLSACQTAVGGARLLDEAVTLAAAVHYTGYQRVIATLWSVRDDTAADVADLVYDDLTAAGVFDPSGAAVALHRAITQLRDQPADVWVPFIHVGP